MRFNEDFEADYAAYLAARDAEKRTDSRFQRGYQTLKNVDKKKTTFNIGGENFYVRSSWAGFIFCDEENNECVKIFPSDLAQYEESELISRVTRALVKKVYGFDSGDAALYGCHEDSDFDKLIENVKLYKEAFNVVKEAYARVNEYYGDNGLHNKLMTTANTRADVAQKNQFARMNAAFKARQSLHDETPDFGEGEFAIWHSKNGNRKVTVVSIDEPNQRAKINTDKGATMYVPLDTLDKVVDYGKYEGLD